MRIAIIGAGPAGLFTAIAAKNKINAVDIDIFEQNRSDETFGWGIVLPESAIHTISAVDEQCASQLFEQSSEWSNINTHHCGKMTASSIKPFRSIERQRMLDILRTRSTELGASMTFERQVKLSDLMSSRYDLIVAADGVASHSRSILFPDIAETLPHSDNPYIWLGTAQPFETFTFIFEPTEHGWIWAHVYPDQSGVSTFIVECSGETWQRFNFDDKCQHETQVILESVFSQHIGDKGLMFSRESSQESSWQHFALVQLPNWYNQNVFLVGDAAYTLHFSIGSGTSKAIEDASELVASIVELGLSSGAFQQCQDLRTERLSKLNNMAMNSMEWFEQLSIHAELPHDDFVKALMKRSSK